MWSIKMVFSIVILSLLFNQCLGEIQGKTLCDVGEWHADFVGHIQHNDIDLSGWQASSLRRIRHLIDEYGDRKVLKPCALLDRFYSYILEESDDDELDFGEFDINNYKPIATTSDVMPSDISKEKTDVQHISDTPEVFEQDSLIPSDNSGNSHATGDPTDDENEENPDPNTIIDPTDLTFLDFEDEEEESDSDDTTNGGKDFQRVHDAYSEISNRDVIDQGDHLKKLDANPVMYQSEKDQVVENSIGPHDASLTKTPQYMETPKRELDKADRDIETNEETTYRCHPLISSHKVDENKFCTHKCRYLNVYNLQTLMKTQESSVAVERRADGHEETSEIKENKTSTVLHGEPNGSADKAHIENKDENTAKLGAEQGHNSESEDRAGHTHDKTDRSGDNKDEDEIMGKAVSAETEPDDNKNTVQEGLTKNDDQTFQHQNEQHQSEQDTFKQVGSDNNGDDRVPTVSQIADNKEVIEVDAKVNVNGANTPEERSHEEAEDNSENGAIVNEDKLLTKRHETKIPDISSILKHQELETSHKIDEIKINLVTLENQFLKQSMDAKDEAISTQHLENHILKLENELYKLNQSYNYLQRDHQTLKRKQKAHNFNILRYQEKINSCPPTTQPKSENNFQLITQQRSRIWELSQVVANQTLNIQHIQSRSAFLEEQNRYLLQVVMDQSTLISNILLQVQEIGENSVKTKLETNALKVSFNQVLTTLNKREQNIDINEDDRRSSVGDNENEVNPESRETLMDSAFIPLDIPETNSGYDINFERPKEKNSLQSSSNNLYDENSHANGTPSVNDAINEISTKTAQPSLDNTPHDIRAIDKDTLDERRNDLHSTHEEESEVSRTPKVDVETLNSGHIERNQREHIKKVDHQKLRTHHILYPPQNHDRASDCFDLYKTHAGERGMNKVFITGLDLSVSVYCDAFGGGEGWTVLMRRDGGREDFYKKFDQYKEGFGSPRSEHYLGNEVIHYLTNQRHYSLRVDLTDWDGNTRHALYDQFWIDREDEQYRLHVYGYSGTAGDGLAKHNGMKFSTFDVDNDLLKKELGGSCARRFKGAGWYYKCYQSNLMGVFYQDGIIPEKRYDGITWKPWKGPNYSMKSVTMSIRPRDVE